MSEKCPRCGSINTHVTRDSKVKQTLAFAGDIALAIAGTSGTAVGNFLSKGAGNFSKNTQKECHCKSCGHKWYI